MRPRLLVLLLGCAAIALGAVVLIRNQAPDDELLGGGVIAAGLGLILGALPAN